MYLSEYPRLFTDTGQNMRATRKMCSINGVLCWVKLVKHLSSNILAVTFCPPPGDLGGGPAKACVEADVCDDEDWGPLYLLFCFLSWQWFLPPLPGPDGVFTVSWSAGSEVSPAWQWAQPDSSDKSKSSDNSKHPHNSQQSALTPDWQHQAWDLQLSTQTEDEMNRILENIWFVNIIPAS